jgi:hypothetical protein
MATKEATCEERIDAQLLALEEDVVQVLQGYYEGEDEGFEAWNNYPLSVSSRVITEIQLSWGGPSDSLKVEHDENHIYRVTYHFQDWFDGATRDVEEDSKVWEYAVSVIEAQREAGL